MVAKNETLLSIGDVSRFLNVPPHTIRYWEKEFKEYLNPGRTVGHQRRYTDDHVMKIRDIMRLLKNEGYSIAGAKKILELKHKAIAQAANPAPMAAGSSAPEDVASRILEIIREQLSMSGGSSSKSAVASGVL